MYQTNNLSTKKHFEDALCDFGMRGQWKPGTDIFCVQTPDKHYEIQWSENNCYITSDDETPMRFDTLSLISNEETRCLKDALVNRDPEYVYKWIVLIDFRNNCKKYILVSKLYLIGSPLNAELFDMCNNKVPMAYMPHRNLTTYLTVDKNGNHNVVTEKNT